MNRCASLPSPSSVPPSPWLSRSPSRSTRVEAAWRRPARVALAGIAALLIAAPVSAQVPRRFPQNALRGTIAFQTPPAISLNGQPALLSPGARVHGLDNMLKMSGALAGSQFVVNYTVERATGLVFEVWLLRDDEAAMQPWPTSADQAAAWTFDDAAQTWTQP